MEHGTVKWYDEDKGYGFIISDVGGKEVFIHRSQIESLEKTLEKGERVEFDVIHGPKGDEARNVNIIDETS